MISIVYKTFVDHGVSTVQYRLTPTKTIVRCAHEKKILSNFTVLLGRADATTISEISSFYILFTRNEKL